MTAEMSVLDLLLDRHDLSLNVKVESEVTKSSEIDMDMKDNDLAWPDPSDDFLNSILQNDKLDSTSFLDPLDGFLPDDLGYDPTSSANSDSGLSSEYLDQQLSPVPLSLSPLPASSDAASDSDSSSTTMDCASLGDVQVQENQPTSNTKLTSPEIPRVRRVIRMTPVATASDAKIPHSILLPVSNLKGGQNLRTIRIINTSKVSHMPAGLHMVCNKPSSSSAAIQAPVLSSTTDTTTDREMPSDTCSEDSDGLQYPRLVLSSEEKRLLKKEGITLPTHYPLTKLEERELKRIRRKIRNKISAQDSRKRKKEYVDGLEERVRRCTDENVILQKRVKTLQSQNTSLAAQVRRLQAMLMQGPATRQVQPATCLMVLLLSLALVVVPNLRPGQQQLDSSALEDSAELSLPSEKPPPVAGRSRTLLYKYPVCSEELPFLTEGEELVEDLCSLQDHDYEPPSKVARHKTPSVLPIEYMDVDDVWPPPKVPPDQKHTVSSSSWSSETRVTKQVNAVLDEAKPNSTTDFIETRAVLLNMASATEK